MTASRTEVLSPLVGHPELRVTAAFDEDGLQRVDSLHIHGGVVSVHETEHISRRQTLVVALGALGMEDPQIAGFLKDHGSAIRSEHTVATHRHRIAGHLGVSGAAAITTESNSPRRGILRVDTPIPDPPTLPYQHYRIVRGVADGHSNREISLEDSLGLSVRQVGAKLAELMHEYFDMPSRVGVLQYAFAARILDWDEDGRLTCAEAYEPFGSD